LPSNRQNHTRLQQRPKIIFFFARFLKQRQVTLDITIIINNNQVDCVFQILARQFANRRQHQRVSCGQWRVVIDFALLKDVWVHSNVDNRNILKLLCLIERLHDVPSSLQIARILPVCKFVVPKKHNSTKTRRFRFQEKIGASRSAFSLNVFAAFEVEKIQPVPVIRHFI